MLNLYIADWHLLFDKMVIEETYLEAISMFQSYSADQANLDALLRPRAADSKLFRVDLQCARRRSEIE